uniref:C-type lectin domain-containing protein n=1 Tax=Electrophorus electricus TaxID=8005 RepID=A0A4W4G1U8_ELEEL
LLLAAITLNAKVLKNLPKCPSQFLLDFVSRCFFIKENLCVCALGCLEHVTVTALQQDFVVMLTRNIKAWTGLTDPSKTKTWKWVDGTAYWQSGEPNGQNEHCVIYNYGFDSKNIWADYPCDNKFAWICERKIFH